MRVFLHGFAVEIGEDHLDDSHADRIVRDVFQCELDHPDLVAYEVFTGGNAEVRDLDVILDAGRIRDFRQRGTRDSILSRGEKRP